MNPKRGNLKLSKRSKRMVSNSSLDLKEPVRKLLSGSHAERVVALKTICEKGGKEASYIGRQLLKSNNQNAVCEGIYLVGTFGSKKDLPLLNTFMYSKNSFIRDRAIEMMGMVREPQGLKYLQIRRNNGNVVVRKNCNKAISLYKGREFELYRELSEDSTFKDPNRRIIRKGLDKDGASTVLLGGKLFDKAIIRGGMHNYLSSKGKKTLGGVGLHKESVDLWIKAFEFDWKKFGFSHNPIEPILRKNGQYRIFVNKDNTLRVSTGVIKGESLAVFQRKHLLSEDQYNSIINQVQMIRTGLDLLKIDHGHLHRGNFVVELVKNKPRVYVIDFDTAVRKV